MIANNKYKEVFISEKNTWIITNSLNDFSKQDFRRDRNAMFKIQGTRAINANAIVAIGYAGDHGPKLRQINSWKEYLLKFYNYDFEVAKKKGNNVPVEKILFLLPSSLALANELVITNYGDKKSNQNIDKFIDGYNSKGKIFTNKVTFKNFINDFFDIYSG